MSNLPRTRLPRKEAKGQQGQWTAKVDGVAYPCIHERYCHGDTYFDPVEGDPLQAGYLDGLKGGYAIMTKSHGPEMGYRRKSYTALFRISPVEYDDRNRFGFKLIERVAELY